MHAIIETPDLTPAPDDGAPVRGRLVRQLHWGLPRPKTYRLRDDAGVVHEHADPKALRYFVWLANLRLSNASDPR